MHEAKELGMANYEAIVGDANTEVDNKDSIDTQADAPVVDMV